MVWPANPEGASKADQNLGGPLEPRVVPSPGSSFAGRGGFGVRLLVRAFPVKLVAWSAASPWGQPLAGYPLARAILSPIAGRFPISKMDREGLDVVSIRALPRERREVPTVHRRCEHFWA